MTNNKTEKIVFNILRWIMVLPSVILTIFLVQIVAGLLINFDWQQEPGFMLKYIAPLIYGGDIAVGMLDFDAVAIARFTACHDDCAIAGCKDRRSHWR